MASSYQSGNGPPTTPFSLMYPLSSFCKPSIFSIGIVALFPKFKVVAVITPDIFASSACNIPCGLTENLPFPNLISGAVKLINNPAPAYPDDV